MKDGYVLGLDLGSSSIKAVLAKSLGENGMEIIASEQLENGDQILSGEIYNVNKTVKSISEVLRRLTHDLDIQHSDLHLSTNITGQHIKFHFFEHRQERINNRQPISEREIFQILNDSRESFDNNENPILHQLFISFKIDNNPETNDPVGLIGSTIFSKVLFITCDNEKMDILKDTISKINEFSFQKKKISFGPIASSSNILSDEEKSEGVILLDLGSGLTEVSLYKNNQLKGAKVINWGGNRITEDIIAGLNISAHHAETIKIKFGSALSKEVDYNEVIMVPGIAGRAPYPISARSLAIIIEERIKELAANILAEIKRVGTPRDFKSGIVLVGGGAQLPYINNLLTKYTNLDCRIGETSIQAKTLKIKEDINNPIFATAVGLSELLINQMNINEEIHEEEEIEQEEDPQIEDQVPTVKKPMDRPANANTPEKEPRKPIFKNFFNKMVDVVMGDEDDGDDY